ncbi:ABC transporter substrate-binding protein [Natribaculum luteum]|uniref:ABC transporter substrate-binding protein n=1 Tax=Natribaculum luteum TaxID=1586232 RepID=A0ABD5P2E1_9EURY|nr:ABC transporter substrate-binding protein [Natribaculum luteum]
MAWDSSAIRRRQIIKGVAAGGSAFVAGCLGGDGDDDGGSSSGSINFVHISSFEPSANDFKEAYGSQSDATLEVQSTPAESSSSREYYVNQFAAQSSEFDVGMMDVVWPAEFVSAGWASEVDDPENHTDEMLPTPVETVTIDGSLYGMPMFTDANGLYYRTDLLEEAGYDEPPSTYMELVDMAQDIMGQSDEDLNGYIWQGGANEGLTIMWLNWLWGMGGSVRDGDGNLVVNTEEGVQALQHAVDLIHEYEITPESIPSSGTDGNRQTFQQGNTIFMRNWPYAYALFQDDTPVTDNFAVTTMPKAEGHEDASNSCIGGWSLFINSFSQNKAAAQELATYVGTAEAQEKLAVDRSRLPVRAELYEDAYWEDSDTDKPAFLDRFSEILDQTSARPAISNYSQWSNIVYTECNNALTQQKSVQEALDDAQEQIDSDINNA